MADPAPPLDVVAIMREIRQSIQRKRAQGIYTDEEVAHLTALRLTSSGAEAQIDERLLVGLLAESHDWNIASGYAITTTRTGLFARVLVLAKKVVRPFVRLYTDHPVNRQAQLNLYFAHVLHDSIKETARLQIEVQALRHKVKVLEHGTPEGGPAR
jgi:hypothetical protein